VNESSIQDNPYGKHIVDVLGLSLIPGIGEVRFNRLLKHFKRVSDVFNAEVEVLAEVGRISRKMAESIKRGYDCAEVQKILAKLSNAGIKIVTMEDADYPGKLREIYDPPPVLYFAGDMPSANAPSVAVIGSRKASSYGKSMTERITAELVAAGMVIVSGFARGIDYVAHSTAIENRGKTIAVMGCGLDIIYPSENKQLYEKIIRSGCAITEFKPGTPPEAGNFPKRNRIISGISAGVVIIEAAQKSGALLTARHALDQGREVFAVPGPANSASSEGTNKLIKSGAKMTTSVADILEELRIQFKTPPISQSEKRKMESLDGDQKLIYQNLDENGVQIDRLAALVSVAMPKLLGLLLEMELSGYVRTLPGKRYARV